MKKLIVEEWLSLDGFATDKTGGLDFFTSITPQQNKYADLDQLKFLGTIDTILLGKKTYDLFVDFWPTASSENELIADKLNGTHKKVFSNTISSAPWGKWEPAEIIRGDAVAEIANLKNWPGKNMVVWGSLTLVQALMVHDLIDEYHIQLCPVLTGGGRKLFSPLQDLTSLKLKEVRSYEHGIVFLRYERIS